MAKMLQELITDVRSRIDEPEEDYFLNREIISWLNEALSDMSLELRLETLANLTPTGSVSFIDLPTDLVSIRSVYVNGQPYTIGTLDDRKKSAANLCYLWGNKLHFTVPITGNVELFYLRDPKRLVVMNDVVDVPDRYVHLLVIYAFSRAKEKDEELATAIEIMNEYRSLKFEMVNETKQKQMFEGNHFVEPFGSGGDY